MTETKKNRPALLLLEDKKYFKGIFIDDPPQKDHIGEIVFNTSMAGYQEIITDPSYKKQIVVFTYPSIGNYGYNKEDYESDKPYLEGIILKDYCEMPSNFRSQGTLKSFLKQYSLPAVAGIDTRALVRYIREKGAMRAGIFEWPAGENTISEKNLDKYINKVLSHSKMEGQNLTEDFNGTLVNEYIEKRIKENKINIKNYTKVAVLDFGIKYSIINNFLEAGILPIVFKGSSSYNTWENFNSNDYKGFFLSNGPGDPASVTTGIKNIEYLLTLKKPIFGICLGHQMLSIALGGKTYKLKFGHHGGNQPVKTKSVEKSKVLITAQNHGFASDIESIKKIIDKTQNELKEEINPNDNTFEGFFINNENYRLLSVQYHPEAGPGPHDALYLFKTYKDLLDKT